MSETIELGQNYYWRIPRDRLLVENLWAFRTIADYHAEADSGLPFPEAHWALKLGEAFRDDETTFHALAVPLRAVPPADPGEVRWRGRQQPVLFQTGGTVVRQIFDDAEVYEAELYPIVTPWYEDGSSGDDYVRLLKRTIDRPPVAYVAARDLSRAWRAQPYIDGYVPGNDEIEKTPCYPPSEGTAPPNGTPIADAALGGRFSAVACFLRSVGIEDAGRIRLYGGDGDE